MAIQQKSGARTAPQPATKAPRPSIKSVPRSPGVPRAAGLARPLAACTIISRNYLSHARILARSFLQNEPGGRFYLLVIDKLPAEVKAGPRIKVIAPEQLKLPYFYEMCFKYDVTELSTAVKPTFLSLLMNSYGEDRLAYFDPDILIARPLEELKAAMDSSSIVLTPHLLNPIPLDGRRPSEQDILIAGAYNLGFIGLSRAPQTAEFLAWWEQRLKDLCRVDPAQGLMTDQKWVDLVPTLFPSVSVLRDETYNVAYWNLNARALTCQGKQFRVNGKPLAFYHFSGFNPTRRRFLSKHQDRTTVHEGTALANLLDLYADLHQENGYAESSKWGYGYAKFDNGVGVNPILRNLYLRLGEEDRTRFGDPFHVNGAASFLNWATRDGSNFAGLSPFLETVYRSRYDVAAAFPDVAGKDRKAFLEWARIQGTKEMAYDPHLVPVTNGHAAAAPAPGKTPAASPSPGANPTGLPGLNICGYLRNESGLGAAARGYIRAVKSLGVPVALKDLSELSVNRSEDPTFTTFDSEHPHDVNLICVNADQHFVIASRLGEEFFHGRYNIGVWAWELPRFPEKWHDRFAHYDEVWVGTSFIAEMLAPVSPVPVVRVPPVLTPPAGQPRGSRAAGRRRLRVGADTFVFLFAFDFHSYFQRKNPLAVIRAFKQAFSTSDPVRLVIKCVNEQTDAEGFAALNAEAANHNVSIQSGYWAAQHLRDLMAACDAYVSLHRSEGTGLTISDAMALGKPVIATGWSGNTDFMNVSNSFPVRFRLVELTEDVGPYRAGETWAEPSVEHAAELMRLVSRDRELAETRGRAAREEIQTRYSEAAVGQLILQRLQVVRKRNEFSELRKGLESGRVLPRHVTYAQSVQRVRRAVKDTLPADSCVIVVSRGDSDLVNLEGRHGWHFPQNEAGVYAGYYPDDSATAIAHLELLRRKGGQFLVFPQTAFWWLEHYSELREHLDRHSRLTLQNEDCRIYDLRPQAEASPVEPLAALLPPTEAGPVADAAPSRAKPPEPYDQLVREIGEIVGMTLEPDSVVAVVSKGDDELLKFGNAEGGRKRPQGWHFPQVQGGIYAGSYPADGAAAVEHLNQLRRNGAGYFLLPATAFWWLQHYGELRRHLNSHCQRIWSDSRCMIFQLEKPARESASIVDQDPKQASRQAAEQVVEKAMGSIAQCFELFETSVEERLKELEAKWQGKLEAADKRQAVSAAAAVEAARAEVSAQVEGKVVVLGLGVNERLSQSDARLNAACERSDAATARAGAIGEQLGLAVTRLDANDARWVDLAAHLGEIAARFESTDGRIGACGQRFDAIDARWGDLAGHLAEIAARFDSTDGRLGAADQRLDAVDARFVAVDARFASVDAVHARTEGRVEVMDGRLNALAAAAGQQAAHAEDLSRQLSAVRRRFSDRPYMARDVFGVAGDLSRPMGYGLDAASLPAGRAEPNGFADLFRGPEDFIAERQRVYLPFFQGAGKVVDLGCGRGEFLRLMAEAKIPSVGVELDPSLVERLKRQGLDVVQGDALSYLSSQPPGCLDGVFSAQVIEHLDPGHLLDFLRLSLRCLRGGGLMIAETVNPESFEALRVFHVDPTHRNPIFPQVLLQMCREAGFPSARIFYPVGGGFTQANYETAGEYAVVAVAPPTGGK